MLILRLVSLILSGCLILVESRTIIKPNTMRYGTTQDHANHPARAPTTLAHMLEYASSVPPSTEQKAIPVPNSYKLEVGSQFHEGRFLDDEDRRLLDEFYRNTKSNDPFLNDGLSTESLWADEERRTKTGALLNKAAQRYDPSTSPLRKEELSYDGWTFDERIIGGSGGKAHVYDVGPELGDASKANYSPHFELLTSYNPMQSANRSASQKDNEMDLSKSSNRIVGATLFGHDQHSKPGVSSKSADEAIRLHNDMLRKPPNDGKVRVRMYYHRAIHDDTKLYGTGPWKYWGHGWGLEFGYDPRKQDKDFYQRGYTIERAFGRDFCTDNRNCRKPDPNFFHNPNTVGKYSEHYFNGIKKSRNRQQHYPAPKRLTVRY